MNAKKIYTTLTSIVGIGVIIAAYLVFGESLTNKVKLLDIVITCFLFLQIFQVSVYPWIRREAPEHREVGMIGIHFLVLNLCGIAAIALIVCGILYNIPFKYQLLGQVIILFFVIVGRTAVLRAGDRVVKVYQKEGLLKQGKLDLKDSFEELTETVDATKSLDAETAQRIHDLAESVRYLSPSDRDAAKMLEKQLILSIADLKLMVRKSETKKERLKEEIDYLARLLERRKKFTL